MKEIIELTQEEKEVYSELNFKFFLDQIIAEQKIDKSNVVIIEKSYNKTIYEINSLERKNKKQSLLYIEGYIRKMHSGGLFATHFNLNEAITTTIFDFEEYGRYWAYFESWSKNYRRELFLKKIWDYTVKIGSILGWILASLQIIEALKSNNMIFKHNIIK
jgi:hypothetical protein